MAPVASFGPRSRSLKTGCGIAARLRENQALARLTSARKSAQGFDAGRAGRESRRNDAASAAADRRRAGACRRSSPMRRAMSGFEPVITSDDEPVPRAIPRRAAGHGRARPRHAGHGRRRAAALPRRRRASTAPVLIISGFDRRVLESAFRLGEALGLKMVGPLEKPVRLEALEAVLERASKPTPGAMIGPAELGLLDGFERALINNRLHMVYQPKVSLRRRQRCTRVEALVRWDDPEFGAGRPVPLRAAGRAARADRRADPVGPADDAPPMAQMARRRASTPTSPSTSRRSASSISISPTWSSACAGRSTCRPTGWCSS